MTTNRIIIGGIAGVAAAALLAWGGVGDTGDASQRKVARPASQPSAPTADETGNRSSAARPDGERPDQVKAWKQPTNDLLSSRPPVIRAEANHNFKLALDEVELVIDSVTEERAPHPSGHERRKLRERAVLAYMDVAPHLDSADRAVNYQKLQHALEIVQALQQDPHH